MLIDTHAHLTDERLDAASIIENMQTDGLEKIITVGYDMRSSREGLQLAHSHAGIYCAVGVHPSDVHKMQEKDLTELLTLSKDPNVVAVGEIGLDYHYPDTDRASQMHWLLRQLDVVAASGLPAVFHLRDAYEDMLSTVRENRGKLTGGAVMHCFSGSMEMLRAYLNMDFYISFSGVITFQNAKRYAELIRAVPLDRMLIETDCPYLTPHPYRGQCNYPKNVVFQAQKIAETLNRTVEEIQSVTTENAYRLFGKMQR